METWTRYLIKHIAPLVTFSGVESTPLLEIEPLIQLNPALQSATAAAGAMFCLKGHASSTYLAESRIAFTHYAAAIAQIKVAISQPEVWPRLPTLWTVFLLSLFELMADMTGQNWIRHTLFGISQLLEAIGPTAMLQARYRIFFREIRIFEASRALITNTQSILARPEWKSLRDTRSTELCHPNETLIDIMIDVADLGYRYAAHMA